MASYKRPASVWLPSELDGKAKEVHARMAIYIDNFVYKPKDERDDSKIYEYLYHITYMLASKRRLFEGKDLDQFALYSANKVYGRLVSERQFDDYTGNKKLPKIVSCLNYIKNSLLGMKVSYQNEFFNQIFNSKLNFDGDNLIQKWKTNLQSENNEELQEAVQESLDKLPRLIRRIIDTTPYSSDKLMRRKLYITCMLSLLNHLKLPNKILKKLAKKESSLGDVDSLKMNYIASQENENIILWHIDEILYDYVDILVKRIKHKLVEEIVGDIKYFEIDDDILNQVLRSPWLEYTNHNVEDHY